MYKAELDAQCPGSASAYFFPIVSPECSAAVLALDDHMLASDEANIVQSRHDCLRAILDT